MSVKSMAGFDLDNRDPNNLNEHLQVMWDDVIGEPEGIRSPDWAWNCSYKCFRGTKNCCYVLLAVIFGPCVAFCSAINFACLAFQFDQYVRNCGQILTCSFSTFVCYEHGTGLLVRKKGERKERNMIVRSYFHFQHIWCIGPFLRSWKINCSFVRSCLSIGLAASCGPCAETCGLYFSKIKVRYQRLPDRDHDEKDIMVV
ncbi:hypothetical protein TCAL_06295 [Tigriopus californicus]|uniref:Caveolin n=1 Tax=Tigriopus californicus TaxID=6832 RepID=A0A553NAQ9_TIGCA|nr:hypothetical protein TCAL_06295 [Tigriopus californicus]|eukprot:TCALIF_06295-PA protein Name:"Similar to CAV1 Caveolin-1 (Rhinolophus ferrumequinum)" AED:0.18 eAED:0.18 QI:145/0.5/0.33/1/0/0.33/3/0/199